MTENLPEEKVCPNCGGTMVLRTRKADGGKFYACQNKECGKFENVDEYKPTKKSTGGGYAKKAAAASNKKADTVTEELKKTYDEVIALFSEEYPESIADPAVLHSLVATVFIEKNRRG